MTDIWLFADPPTIRLYQRDLISDGSPFRIYEILIYAPRYNNVSNCPGDLFALAFANIISFFFVSRAKNNIT